MPVLEDAVVARWLHAVLTANATLVALATGGVHRDRMPQETSGLAVVYRRLSMRPLKAFSGGRYGSAMVWLVFATAETRSYYGSLGTAAYQIRATIDDASGSNVDGTIWECVEGDGVQYEDPDDPGWLIYGFEYAIRAKSA